MKTRNCGYHRWGKDARYHPGDEYRADRLTDSEKANMCHNARCDYLEKRFNGDEKRDAPPGCLPEDGKITWVTGHEREDVGNMVYGKVDSERYYHYECRYDEGQGERIWMEECDRNYLARLHLTGAKTNQEKRDLAENRDPAARAAEEVARLPEAQLSNWLKTSEELRKFKVSLHRREAERLVAAQKAGEEQAKREQEQLEYQRQREYQERAEKVEVEQIKTNREKRRVAEAQKEHKALDAKLEAKLNKYRCSITNLIMVDPVQTADGHTYEREAIEEWLEKHNTSPKTNLQLTNKVLTPNVALKEFTQELLENHPELWDCGEVYEPLEIEVKFVRAVRHNRVDELTRIMAINKRLVKIPIADQKSMLSFALEQKSIAMAKLAIRYLGKDIKAIPELEAQDGSIKLFQCAADSLATEGAKVIGDVLEWKQNDYQLAFWHGVQNNNKNLVRTTLELKVDPAELNSDGLRPIHVAVEKEAANIVEVLLKHTAIDSLDARGLTPLHRGIINNQLEQVNLALRYKADVNKKNPAGLTPLEISFEKRRSGYGDLEIAEILLEKKADPNVADSEGQTLFLKALTNGMSDFMRLLVKDGVDLNKANARGEVPIHQAFLFFGKELETTLNILVEGQINLEAKDSAGNTALLRAVESGLPGAVEILLKAGANKEAVDANGNLPLHLAVQKGSAAIVKLLLDAGANPNARNRANKKPINLAKEAKNDEIVELLRAKTFERRIAPFLHQLQNRIMVLEQQNAELKQEITILKSPASTNAQIQTAAAPASSSSAGSSAATSNHSSFADSSGLFVRSSASFWSSASMSTEAAGILGSSSSLSKLLGRN